MAQSKRLDVTTMLIIASLVVILGRWSKGQKFEFKVVTGLAVVLILITGLDTVAPEVAGPLATLAMVAALLNYGPDIFKNLSGSPQQSPLVGHNGTTPSTPSVGQPQQRKQ